MKRGIVLLLTICLFLLPSAAATLSISSPVEGTYNIGDELNVEGYVFKEEATSGFLQFIVNCEEENFPRQLIPLKLAAGEQKTFTELSIPDILLTSSMLGTCSVESSLIVAGVEIEEEFSESFEVTQELNGLFSLDKTKIQMGDSFKLSGTVTKMNAEKITGTTEIYFENEGTEYLIDIIPIYGGAISYTYGSANSYPGEYSLNLVVRDSYGNQQRFDAIETFEIVSDLSVLIDTEENNILPSTILNLFGSVKNIEQNPLDQATVDIYFNDEILASTSLIAGEFSYDLEISPAIKSGTHTIKVEVEDLYGNNGEAQTTFEVTPVATVIENQMEDSTFIPEDILDFEVSLYDQAGELMDNYLTLEIFDSTGALISQKEVESSTGLTFKFPQFATPGTWTIKTYSGEIIAESLVTVEEFENMQMWVEGETLYVRNAGNIRYKDDLQVLVTGAGYDYTITKKRSIGVNETIAINLAEEVPSGSYSVELPTGNTLLNVENVEVVNGTKRYRLGWMYIALTVLFVGGLSYLVYGRAPRKRPQESSKRFGKRTPTQTIQEQKPKKNKKSSLTFSKEKGLADFKERIVKDIKATEAQIQQKETRAASRSSGAKLATVMGKKEAPQPKQEGNFFKLFD